jgi:ADP-ribosyl-[dinitrogen reductase] hydrolase
MMVGAALLQHAHDSSAFQRALGRKLRWWLAALPAGVGLSTGKAILRLWLGFPARRSGVRSAGNGAAMRSALIGCYFRETALKRQEFALAACRVTHTDPRAEESALLVAEAASFAAKGMSTEEVVRQLEPLLSSTEMQGRYRLLNTALANQSSVAEYAAAIGSGNGVSGFAPNTVAVALYAWLRHRGDFPTAVAAVIRCGGDTDTGAAITGAICGAESGEFGIPAEWIANIADWPRSINYLRGLADSLRDGKAAPRLCWPCIPLRNALFFFVVILHGLRRLFPPY